MRTLSTFLLKCIILLPSFGSYAQDVIVQQTGEKSNVKIVDFSQHVVSYEKDGKSEKIPTLELKWFSKGDKIYAVYPQDAAAEDFRLTFTQFKEAITEKEYAVILHSKTILDDVAFATGKAELTPASRAKTLPAIKYLAQQKGFQYDISVHSDSSGTAAANLTISQRRAAALKTLFKTQGLAKAEITGRGMEEPAFLEKKDQLKNRRVEFSVAAIENVEIIYAEQIPEVVAVEAAGKAVVAEAAVEQEKRPTEVSKSVKVTSQKIRYSSSSDGYFFFTVGLDGLKADDKNKTLSSSEQGFPVNPYIGASLRIGKKSNENFGWAFTTGVSGFKSEINYTDLNGNGYSGKDNFMFIPARIGVRGYLFNTAYIMPEVGALVTLMKASTTENHPNPSLNLKETHVTYQFGGSVGADIRVTKSLLVDASFFYYLSPLKNSAISKVYNAQEGFMSNMGIRLAFGIFK